MTLDCLIVGAGPAGLVAALYLQRFHRRVWLADAGRSRARWIDRSHNVPGFPGGIGGPELLARLTRQLAEAGGAVHAGEVQALARDGAGFVARAEGRVLHARTVLLATGVVDAVPLVPGTDLLRRAGRLRQCPICDAHEWRGRRIVVVGEGPHAEAEARFIGRYGSELTRVAPRHLQRFVFDGDEVQVVLDGHALRCDVVYAALGVRPRTQLARPLGASTDARGALVTDASQRSSVQGLWAAGDVVSALDQIAVATGHGAIAATSIHNALGT